MTAEVVVMNREAVALAADSAVTIGGGPKILNTANKVFMLAPGYPVGILLYSNAYFMDMPWEIIIKAYRDEVLKTKEQFSDLCDYSQGFIEFIEKQGNILVTDEQEANFFKNTLDSVFKVIVEWIWDEIKDTFYKKAEISDEEIKIIVRSVVSQSYTIWDQFPENFQEEKAVDFRSRLIAKFDNSLEEIIHSNFEKLPLSRRDFNKLKDMGIHVFSKDFPGMLFTGIVFAGYGINNFYPKCIEYRINCLLCGTLVYKLNKTMDISLSKNGMTAAILPFAQDDVAHLILSGRIPGYENKLREKFNKKLKKADVDGIIEEVKKEIWVQHTQPIIDTIDVLPKDELASVAKTLVSLTSFMRRVSSDIESVGGPIDVAVISKKDGFIWIDRKHYFDINKNLHFGYERQGT